MKDLGDLVYLPISGMGTQKPHSSRVWVGFPKTTISPLGTSTWPVNNFDFGNDPVSVNGVPGSKDNTGPSTYFKEYLI